MSYSLIERLQIEANPGKANTTSPPPPQDIMGNAATRDSSPEVSVITTDQACQVLGVSCSGYYAHQVMARERLAKPVVCAAIVHFKAAFASSQNAYGFRRLRKAMAERGLTMGIHRISTMMRVNGMRPVWRHRFSMRLTVNTPWLFRPMCSWNRWSRHRRETLVDATSAD